MLGGRLLFSKVVVILHAADTRHAAEFADPQDVPGLRHRSENGTNVILNFKLGLLSFPLHDRLNESVAVVGIPSAVGIVVNDDSDAWMEEIFQRRSRD